MDVKKLTVIEKSFTALILIFSPVTLLLNIVAAKGWDIEPLPAGLVLYFFFFLAIPKLSLQNKVITFLAVTLLSLFSVFYSYAFHVVLGCGLTIFSIGYLVLGKRSERFSYICLLSYFSIISTIVFLSIFTYPAVQLTTKGIQVLFSFELYKEVLETVYLFIKAFVLIVISPSLIAILIVYKARKEQCSSSIKTN